MPWINQIESYGQRVQLYGLDDGHTWSSSPRSIVAFGQREQRLGFDVRKRFERIHEFLEPDPNDFTENERVLHYSGSKCETKRNHGGVISPISRTATLSDLY